MKRAQNPWITDAVIKSISNKNKLFKDFKVGAITYDDYKLYRNTLNNVVRAAKQNHYINNFNNYKNSTKNIWKKIKELQGNNSTQKAQSIKVNNKLSNNSHEIANAFNNFYVNIAPQLDLKIPCSNLDPLSYLRGNYVQSMVVPQVLIQDTVEAIKSLKDKNDFKSLPTQLIKSNCNHIAIPLTKLFNQSITVGQFPKCFKHAQVTPPLQKRL